MSRPPELGVIDVRTLVSVTTYKALVSAAKDFDTTVAVVAAHILERAAGNSTQRSQSQRRSRVKLTPELVRRIRELTAEGMLAPAIARRLNVSIQTVYNYRKADT